MHLDYPALSRLCFFFSLFIAFHPLRFRLLGFYLGILFPEFGFPELDLDLVMGGSVLIVETFFFLFFLGCSVCYLASSFTGCLGWFYCSHYIYARWFISLISSYESKFWIFDIHIMNNLLFNNLFTFLGRYLNQFRL